MKPVRPAWPSCQKDRGLGHVPRPLNLHTSNKFEICKVALQPATGGSPLHAFLG